MLRELKTLIEVARRGTFAAAGDVVGLTQAAVSAQMQRLEAELGFALFTRVGRSAQLNERGRMVVAQAADLLRQASQLGEAAPDAAAGRKVVIGAIASLQCSVLARALAQFHRQCAGSQTCVVPGVSIDLLTRVDAGELDMAAVVRPPFALHDGLQWTTIAREPFVLLVPRSCRGSDWLELLQTQRFIRYDRNSFGGRAVDRFLAAHQLNRLQEVCEIDELDAIVQLVAHEVGVALLPQTVGRAKWPAGVRAIDLGVHRFYRDVGLVSRGTGQLSAAAALLTQVIAGQADPARARSGQRRGRAT